MARQPLFLISFSLLGIGFLGANLGHRPSPIVFFNPSESAAIGWYRVVTVGDISRGDLVISNLPVAAKRMAAERDYLPAGLPVIKTVWALGGDTVCVHGSNLAVAGHAPLAILTEDRQGRPLRAWREDCTVLGPEDVFLASPRTPDSFDSRYFGPVNVSDVIGRAVFLGDHQQGVQGLAESAAGDVSERERKNKAHGVNEGLVPCLHIYLHGSTLGFLELGFVTFSNDCRRMACFHMRFGTVLTCAVPQ